jgi:hypothetical protein
VWYVVRDSIEREYVICELWAVAPRRLLAVEALPSILLLAGHCKTMTDKGKSGTVRALNRLPGVSLTGKVLGSPGLKLCY